MTEFSSAVANISWPGALVVIVAMICLTAAFIAYVWAASR